MEATLALKAKKSREEIPGFFLDLFELESAAIVVVLGFAVRFAASALPYSVVWSPAVVVVVASAQPQESALVGFSHTSRSSSAGSSNCSYAVYAAKAVVSQNAIVITWKQWARSIQVICAFARSSVVSAAVRSVVVESVTRSACAHRLVELTAQSVESKPGKVRSGEVSQFRTARCGCKKLDSGYADSRWIVECEVSCCNQSTSRVSVNLAAVSVCAEDANRIVELLLCTTVIPAVCTTALSSVKAYVTNIGQTSYGSTPVVVVVSSSACSRSKSLAVV